MMGMGKNGAVVGAAAALCMLVGTVGVALAQDANSMWVITAEPAPYSFPPPSHVTMYFGVSYADIDYTPERNTVIETCVLGEGLAGLETPPLDGVLYFNDSVLSSNTWLIDYYSTIPTNDQGDYAAAITEYIQVPGDFGECIRSSGAFPPEYNLFSLVITPTLLDIGGTDGSVQNWIIACVVGGIIIAILVGGLILILKNRKRTWSPEEFKTEAEYESD
ncbi:hypothetical protein FVE85_1143 [Porphyridium purpureum]|uniref:Uncharacterized protein n=1 Tax=Porphyridium purpureum TaxID=35688 RepID=A0A5J4Z3D8_PORPP|nr:hypothetical protein FVE85_1143 [Porphyridium purpureum]|eukprot:POR5136..scf208_2